MRRCRSVRLARRKPIIAAALLLLVVIVIALYISGQVGDEKKCTEGERFSRLTPCSLPWIRHGQFRLPSICWSRSCRAEYALRQSKSRYQQPIPAIRHVLWRDEFVSENLVTHLRSWQKIHPDWTIVLWRDVDMEPFVTAHFPCSLQKFKSLKKLKPLQKSKSLQKFKSLDGHMMRVDMIRHMLLYKYGGVYADLDYTLVKSLDQFRSNYAVLTQEPEAHSLQFLNMTWPPKLLLSPAFMMSAPNHTFFNYVIQSLRFKSPSRGELFFAGTLGLTEIMENYRRQCPIGTRTKDIVIVPPSYSFYPYRNNRLDSSRSNHIPERLRVLEDHCDRQSSRSADEEQEVPLHHQLVQFCKDLTNMDPITDKSQPVFAIHDVEKPGASFEVAGSRYFSEKPIDIRLVLKNVKYGSEFI